MRIGHQVDHKLERLRPLIRRKAEVGSPSHIPGDSSDDTLPGSPTAVALFIVRLTGAIRSVHKMQSSRRFVTGLPGNLISPTGMEHHR